MVLIDSSIWIDALRVGGPAASRDRVAALVESGDAAWCPPVRLELWGGVASDRERRVLAGFASLVTDLPITEEVWERAIVLAQTARRRGQTFPHLDVVVFACARVHGVEVLHRDRHFDALAKL